MLIIPGTKSLRKFVKTMKKNTIVLNINLTKVHALDFYRMLLSHMKGGTSMSFNIFNPVESPFFRLGCLSIVKFSSN